MDWAFLPVQGGIRTFCGDGKVQREQPWPGQPQAPIWPQPNLSGLILVRLSLAIRNKPAPSITMIQSLGVKTTWNSGVSDLAASVYLLEWHHLPESSIVYCPFVLGQRSEGPFVMTFAGSDIEGSTGELKNLLWDWDRGGLLPRIMAVTQAHELICLSLRLHNITWVYISQLYIIISQYYIYVIYIKYI